MPTLQVIEIKYEYQKNEEADLLPLLKMLQTEVDGESKPYWMRAGALDLLTFLEIVISFIAGAAATTVVRKYFEGLLDTDAVKKLGEKHRKQLREWFSKFETDLEKVVETFQRAYEITGPIVFQRKPKAAAIRINFGLKSLYIVLNHEETSPRLLLSLPKGIVQALHFLAESSISEYGTIFQLYFNKTSCSWKYLFMPTEKAFGHWIDRYVELDSKQVTVLSSQKEFINKFQPHSDDHFKFLVDPFREPLE